MFWQSGWDPLRTPAQVAQVRDNRPDLFQYPILPKLPPGIPHESSRPAPGEYLERWWYEKQAAPTASATVKPQ